jgi:hypothetical protein
MPYAVKQCCNDRSVFSHCSRVVPGGTQTWRDARITLFIHEQYVLTLKVHRSDVRLREMPDMQVMDGNYIRKLYAFLSTPIHVHADVSTYR